MLSKYPDYHFTVEDFQLVNNFARNSVDYHQSKGRNKNKVMKDIITGKLGEIAYEKMTEGEFGKTNFDITTEADPGWDFHKDGYKIDVKTIGPRSRSVTVNLNRLLSHVYVIIEIDKEKVCTHITEFDRASVRRYAIESQFENGGWYIPISKIKNR